MKEKPSFNLSELGPAKSLNKCREFLPRLQASNTTLTTEISQGNRTKVVDTDISFYRGENCPEYDTTDSNERDIVLDVGVGVFDVNNADVDDSLLKKCGITTVTVDNDNRVFAKEEPLITEVTTQARKSS